MQEEKDNYRLERIKRLLKELEYEVTRGVIEREVQEITFQFQIPVAINDNFDCTECRFEIRPSFGFGMKSNTPLKVVK